MASCGGSDLVFACTDQLNSTLGVRVFNAKSGLREPGSTIIVRGSGVYDSVTVHAPQFDQYDYLAWENKVDGGTYTVTVRKAGFIEKTTTAVVTSDRCHAGPGPAVDVSIDPVPSPPI